ncbi:DUF262 domain-containing protein [uncultured Cardiobacterium sp.]|uniref:DUF262 domain-containing protein n=1 Tax=uncultured Cardiobacterium sp. TaxID=417619 RepID=UPI00263439AF|nr:DUF262 domain-containing protein [uncultured Cardiobacterium sp.]
MNFNFNIKTFRDLLGTNFNQLVIPRFQRDYSWEKEHISEFLDDLVFGLNAEETSNKSPYFFGTILVVGDITGSKGKLEVIDGQQRITTATILLSVIGKLLDMNGENSLAIRVWEYIVKTTDNDEKITILQNDTLDDFFKDNVQDRKQELSDILKKGADIPDDETRRIFEAIKYFFQKLKKEQIKKLVKKEDESYIESLKRIRDALLESQVICISTVDKGNANLIFEILNSKGKKLEDIDLIKNEIFRYLNNIEPKDNANSKWKKIKIQLAEREKIEISTFYRHFWSSRYSINKRLALYEQFKAQVSKEKYEDFLNDLQKAAESYKKIISPYLSDYDKKDKYMVDSLNYLGAFNIKQCRPLLLSLLRAKEKGILTPKNCKKILTFLPRFHFAYNALCKKNPNAIETKYTDFSVLVSKSNNSNDLGIIIDDIIRTFKDKLPTKNEFLEKFIKLSYSSNEEYDSNILSKFAISEIEKKMSNRVCIPDNYTIEHIVSEKDTRYRHYSLNIGNLIYLEDNLNQKCGNSTLEVKVEIYKKSNSKSTEDFLKTLSDKKFFEEEEIEERSKYLANCFYELFE